LPGSPPGAATGDSTVTPASLRTAWPARSTATTRWAPRPSQQTTELRERTVRLRRADDVASGGKAAAIRGECVGRATDLNLPALEDPQRRVHRRVACCLNRNHDRRGPVAAPRGTQDLIPPQSARWQELEARIHALARSYGYGEIRTPMFDTTNLFKRSIGEGTDIVSKEMYTFTGRSDRSLTLRPESTAVDHSARCAAT